MLRLSPEDGRWSFQAEEAACGKNGGAGADAEVSDTCLSRD